MYLLFDIGGTNMRLTISKDGTEVGEPLIEPTDPDNFEESMKRFISAAKQLVGSNSLKGIAGGVPGPLNQEKSEITSAPNMAGWVNQPLQQTLEQALGAPAYIENDTVMIGMGEAQNGAGKGKHIVTYLTVSTGVGGARIVDGLPDQNTIGFEPGHQIINSEDTSIQCGCKGYGHLEAYISGANLEKQHGIPPAEITDQEVWEKAAHDLAIGLNNVLVFWSPDIIVLGGSVMASIDVNEVTKKLAETVTIFSNIPPVVRAELGERGGLLGALSYLKRKI